jgi:Family of unknown function (DUF6879)
VHLEGEAWSRYFRDFRSSAFRLELHPVYTMPGEADELRRFKAGEKPPADYHYGWLDTVASAVRAGKAICRVRVVRRPLPDYVRYEFEWGFIYNVAAGEDIRVLDLTDRLRPELPDHDFWLFDEATVVRMLYRPDGTQIGRELVQDPDLDAYRCYRNAAWQDAVPFRDYWAGLARRV